MKSNTTTTLKKNNQNINDIIKARKHFREGLYGGILGFIGFFQFILLLLIACSMLVILIIKPSLKIGTIWSTLFYSFIKYLLVYMLLIPFFIALSYITLVGFIRGNLVKITAKQFPDIYAMLEKQAKILQLPTVPTAYILNGNGVLQALAFRFLRNNYVVLFSDLVAGTQKNESALSFIISHELAHIKLNHVSMVKSVFLAIFKVPILTKAHSRAREYSCDAIAQYLVPQGAEKGIIMLATGKHLFNQVDIEEHIRESKKDQGFTTWLSEFFMTHPHLINRLEAVRAWSKK